MKCPFCAEEIQDEATKCRYCSEWIHPPAVNARRAGVIGMVRNLHWFLRSFIMFVLLNWIGTLYWRYIVLSLEGAVQDGDSFALVLIFGIAWAVISRPLLGAFVLSSFVLVYQCKQILQMVGGNQSVADIVAEHYLLLCGVAVIFAIAWLVKAFIVLLTNRTPASPKAVHESKLQENVTSKTSKLGKLCPKCSKSAPLTNSFCTGCGHQYRTKFE